MPDAPARPVTDSSRNLAIVVFVAVSAVALAKAKAWDLWNSAARMPGLKDPLQVVELGAFDT